MNERTREPSLTPRQVQCLEGRLIHLTAKEIGRRLNISPHTVAMHWRHARWKFGVGDTLSAAKALRRKQGNVTEANGEAHDQSPSRVDRWLRLLAAAALLMAGWLTVLMLLVWLTIALQPRWLADS